MRLSLTRSEGIELTTIITPLTLSPLWLLFMVRLGGYIVNSCDFYSYSLIGKLTAFLPQEFSFHNMTMVSSTSTVRLSLHNSKQNLVYVTHSPITLTNFSSINLVFIFRCWGSPNNPLYVRHILLIINKKLTFLHGLTPPTHKPPVSYPLPSP